MNNKRSKRLRRLKMQFARKHVVLPRIDCTTGGEVNFKRLIKRFWTARKREPESLRELLLFRGMSEDEVGKHGL